MKKKCLLIMLLILAFSTAMIMTACGKNDSGSEGAGEAAEEGIETAEEEVITLEKYAAENPDFQDAVDNAMGEGSATRIVLDGNDVVYYIDMSQMDNVTEESVKSDQFKTLVEDGLENAKTTFGDVAVQLEGLSGVEGIRVIMIYTWGDEAVVTSRPFTSADVAQE